MAEKKMTRKEALELAIRLVNHVATEDDAANWSEVAEVLTKMHEQVSKPRKKSDAPSKTRLINENLATKCVAAMEGHEKATSKWLVEHVNGLLTPQKTTAVMKIAIDDGRVVRTKEGKTVYYSLAE